MEEMGIHWVCFISIVALVLNLYAGVGMGQSIVGLIGVAILFGVLHIGGDKKAWPQLE